MTLLAIIDKFANFTMSNQEAVVNTPTVNIKEHQAERHLSDHIKQSHTSNADKGVMLQTPGLDHPSEGDPSRMGERRMQRMRSTANLSPDEMLDYIETLEGRVDRRETAITNYRIWCTDYKCENNSLQEEKLQLEDEIRHLQEKSFKSLDDPKWMPLDDSSIEREILSLEKDIDRWAKTYRITEMRDIIALNIRDQQALIKALDGVLRFESKSGGIPWHVLEAPQTSRLCLTGLLSKAVHCTILANPFFFLDDGLDIEYAQLGGLRRIGPVRQDAKAMLMKMYGSIKAVNEPEAQLWRSQLLRLLWPSCSNGDQASQAQRHESEMNLQAACQRASAAFLTSPAQFLLKRVGGGTLETCYSDLERIITAAGKLSIKLWTQRTALRISGLFELHDNKFSNASRILQAHALHKLDDPQDTSLDGKLPRIIVHPAVLGLGTHDGDDYGTSRIWAKAVVWMDT